MKKSHFSKIWKCPLVLAWMALLLPLAGCGNNGDDNNLVADFNFGFVDANNVRFSNQSQGEYARLNWDFGNGQSESTTSKSKDFTVYYPEKGEYSVSLSVIDFDGNSQTQTKKLTIDRTDFAVSFTATVDAENANYVDLVNTSIGIFDSFEWQFRKRNIQNQSSAKAYFPFAGSYEIVLQVNRGGETFSAVQNVTIAGDDPDYLSKLELVWEDNFDGNEVNTDNWTFETGAGGWGNNELQNYTAGNNVKVQDGILTITAEKVDDNKVAGSYTSARMISRDKKEFTYGRMEIRAQLPSGTGIWPAIWMLGSNIGSVGWPACGEIDIMEYVGYQPNTVHATIHTGAGSGSNGSGSNKTLETAEEEFLIYGLIWTEGELIFYTDSPENITYKYSPNNKTDDNWPFDKAQFFILNVAVGGNWGGAQGIDNAIFPQSMKVDYVKVFQEK